jgi:hypothetical protein
MKVGGGLFVKRTVRSGERERGQKRGECVQVYYIYEMHILIMIWKYNKTHYFV